MLYKMQVHDLYQILIQFKMKNLSHLLTDATEIHHLRISPSSFTVLLTPDNLCM